MSYYQLNQSFTRLALTFFTMLALAMAQTVPTYAQSGGHGDGGGGENSVTSTNTTQGITNGRTAAIVVKLGSAISECRLIPREYQADCLAQNMRESSKLAKSQGYRPVNAELQSAAQQISQLVEQNLDNSAPKLRLGKKTYRAVKKSALVRVNQRAAAIVTETSTKLLRSTGNSALKKVHYARIAKAVNSTKVLLRSA